MTRGGTQGGGQVAGQVAGQPAVAAPVAGSGNVFPMAMKGEGEAGHIEYVKETLPNGLKVIYAPMKSPGVHVRVLYHVGSRDESPDRTGFAHMFEHMMFRGSAHVAPEEHMRLITLVGGNSNAFTSFDQTTYVNTLPASNTEMALYLEADRMASFKVSDEIFKTERKVVAEEWRLRTANPPTGTMGQDIFGTAFTQHHYHWTPIGDMDQLKMASSSELQTFFNKYYVPNNACLIIAGDIDVAKTAWEVRKYFGWIPRGPEVTRDNIPVEPEQTAERRVIRHRPAVQLGEMALAYKGPAYRSDDHYALDAVGSILGRGRTSRFNRALVNPAPGVTPIATSASAGDEQLEDPSLFMVSATVAPEAEPDAVENGLKAEITKFIAEGPTETELTNYKTLAKQQIIRGRETCTEVATQLGDAEVFGGDAEDVNRELAKVEALTGETLKAVAAKYLRSDHATVVEYLPGNEPASAGGSSTAPSADASKADAAAKADVVASAEKVEPRVKGFPPGYPTTPPMGGTPAAKFNTGQVSEVNGVQVITLTDKRLPVANFTLVMRGGGDAEPKGKEGLAGLTADMLRRGSQGYDFLTLAQELEKHGVSVVVTDGGDTTRLMGGGMSDQLAYAIDKAALVLTQPTFPEPEFNRLKQQSLAGLRRSFTNNATVAGMEVGKALWGDTPAGRTTTMKSVAGITLDDVKDWYSKVYRKDGAILVFSGDVTPEQANALAAKLVANLPTGQPLVADYDTPTGPASRRIILVDNPQAKQATVRVVYRGYTLKSDERFAGSVASQVLTAGLDSRMNKYLRAERGLTYGASGVFTGGRHIGSFAAAAETNPETTGACVDGMLKVIEGMRSADITDEELKAAALRSAGAMVMETQTVSQQAGRRLDTVLNDWPTNYWEGYAAKIGGVTKDQVRAVMSKYTAPDNAVIVVVAPASVKDQLTPFGEVEVLPMPLARK